MENSSAEEVEKIIEELVSSGKPILDDVLMKKLKSICKHNDSCLEYCFSILLSQLLKDHCEVRYSAFQIISELFIRSHLFRTLLLENFHQFMDCTIETDFDNPLPPPKNVANKLKEDALFAIKSWFEKYGIAYQKLSLAYEFLKHSKKFKLDQLRPAVRDLNHEKLLSRKAIVNGMKLDKLNKDINENMWEIESALTEIHGCLELLVPTFDNEDTVIGKNQFDNTNNLQNVNDNSCLREAGLPERGYAVEIDLSVVSAVKVVENEDNKPVFDRLKDLMHSTNRLHFPKLQQWLHIASKCGAEPNLIKQLIDVKVRIQHIMIKCNDLKVGAESDEEDINDFVEVPDNLTQSNISSVKVSAKKTLPKRFLKSTSIWKPLKDDDVDLNDPTTYKFALAKQAQILNEKKKSSSCTNSLKLKKIIPKSTNAKKVNSKTKTLLEKAPVVSFGRDLLTWDAEKYQELKSSIMFGAPKELDVGHRFYGGHSASETDKGISDAAMSSITSRTIEFTGEFTPVKQKCNAPLPSGKLCPRQDRFKCPFHGKIVPRDACGNPISPSDQPSTSRSHDAWNDAEFLNDLEGNLGTAVSLLKKSKKSKKPETGLTDLKRVKNTSRNRLQRKVLSAKSLKRVAETMDVLDAKRNLDKFGNNFNYALH